MRRALAVAVLVSSAFAGCLEEIAEEFESHEFLPSTAVVRDPAAAAPREPFGVSDVAFLHPGVMLSWEADCPCPLREFILQPTLGEAVGEWLDVRVRWDGTLTPDLEPVLEGPDGRVHRESQRGFDDRRLVVWQPAGGLYSVAVEGSGPAAITVRLGSLAVPSDGEMRPNLVEMVIEGPAVGPCDEVERTEQGAVKCLRFGNGVGNPGHGPLQIRLALEEGAQALAPLGGRFTQEVRRADGSVAQHEVGPATFHPTHSHWHYDGFATFELFRVDPVTGLRGELASTHHKSGFCFLDWDRMVENVTEPAEQERAETDCLVPGLGMAFGGGAGVPAWTNGISRGWYDFYEAQLTDQYVDIDGLPAGTYELVATADPLQTLDETDDTDNQSSLLLHIDGDDIEVLQERAHFRVQEDDDH
jgi:hypothetical protein